MLCPDCGEKLQCLVSSLVCRMCNSEYDMLEIEDLIPEKIFSHIKLRTGDYTVVNTRESKVIAKANNRHNAILISMLLNKQLATLEVKKHIKRYVDQEA